MWANGSPAYLSGLSSVPSVPLLRERPVKKVDNKTGASQRGQTSDSTGTLMGLAGLYMPAGYYLPPVQVTPSSETSRQVQADMKLSASLRRGQANKGHRTAASSSSSVTSLAGDLDHGLHNMDLVRRSSFTSTESTSVSRDASEALQQFSKSLFHRRGRSKQESTSSGSSLYSADAPMDASSSKDSVLPKLFSRRKPSRDEPATLQKRFQISDPYNFQHVTHTNRDAVEDAMTLDDDNQSDPNQPRGRPRAATGASQHTYTNVLAEPVAENEIAADFAPARPSLVARHTGSFHTMRRFINIKSGKMPELSPPLPPPPPPPTSVPASATAAPVNKPPPQRPPRSPPISPESPPVPARVSSRQRLRSATGESRTSYFAERHMIAAGFQRPRPFTPSSPVEPPPMHHAFPPPTADLPAFPQEALLCRPRTATPEPSWPLASPTIASFEAPLPELVADDGHTSWSSVTGAGAGDGASPNPNRLSGNASLRGSKSVPTLAKLAEEQDAGVVKTQYVEPSAWSAQMRMELQASLCESPVLGRASWEDDIDYCYEHEAEADCDYQWERPSMDVAPGGRGMYAAAAAAAALDKAPLSSPPSGMLFSSASGVETVPELSPPISQTSAMVAHEAMTPPPLARSVDSQFVLRHKCTELIIGVARHDAHDSEFSPSLLVPRDDFERDSSSPSALTASSLQQQQHEQRASTTTVASNYTSSSDSVGERHASTNSSWTALTRHTASTSSLNKLGMSWVDEVEPVPALAAEESRIAGPDETPLLAAGAEEDVVMALPASPPRSLGRRNATLHKSHASESVLGPAPSTDSQQHQLPKSRRPRARTSSMGQAPPVGQYALFPRSTIKTHGDKI
ncbi:PAK-box/P21-Rho-binding protein [Cordyceps fumosorosea ARSEF 2679]|uniref:PAK-box/P21-Rho-binding protein n=1 Tax=Cordyceps fumosorosea (strain ARSEF 2679) TaxID=1081104 RepID=A0A167S8B9_CORFA|nr:PAK-box/P21-Rho-binding protein [Cordyceps fumosorosea ARSEF 2679]OAA59361.1 PAK-box/P21-Rho-binding protein [Cordyceps fumosorosea ARSEF 2679]